MVSSEALPVTSFLARVGCSPVDSFCAGFDREPTLSFGPEYSSRFKTPRVLAGSSTESASSQSTGRPEQVRGSEFNIDCLNSFIHPVFIQTATYRPRRRLPTHRG